MDTREVAQVVWLALLQCDWARLPGTATRPDPHSTGAGQRREAVGFGPGDSVELIVPRYDSCGGNSGTRTFRISVEEVEDALVG